MLMEGLSTQYTATKAKLFFIVPRHPCLKRKWGGGTPFSTIRFLEVRKKNMENLFLPKVLYVTKGCLKNLARAKSALRARNSKKPVFGAIDLCPPPQVPSHILTKQNQFCRYLPNSLKCAQFFF